MVSIGYIDANNKLTLYPNVDPNIFKNYVIGNSNITVGQALAGQDLSKWNKPLEYSWSFSNLLKNVDSGFNKSLIIGAVALIGVALLK